MKNNRIIILSLALLLCIGLVSGCGEKTAEKQTSVSTENKLSVVCTTFPSCDWVKEVIGERKNEFDVTFLLDDGTDLHNYQPTAEDIAKIAECDLFIYVGGESDKWVDDALKEATNKNMRVINLMEVLGERVKEEEVIEGMEEEHEHEDGEEHEYEETEEVEYDEHVWLSLKNAQAIVNELQKTLSDIDKDNAQVYIDNGNAYVSKLQEMDGAYETAVQSGMRKAVLFGDRFPFRYLADDYGIEYYAAFAGCSAETEASFETIAFLAGKADEMKLPVILKIESSDSQIAEAIKNSTKDKNQQILVMNSLQSVTSSDAESGFSYLSAMKDNLDILKQALN